MARAVLREMVFGLAATGLLMGCVAGGGSTAGSGGSAGSVAAPGKKSGAQDVEAPEVFQTTDSALWDGRPSLGGIWVAAPEVTNPERAIMFNPATGKSVTGALFRRERENPGPRLQLSSDAAEALGILAGQPTEIRVTALRKEEVAAPAEVEVAAAEPAAAASTEPAAADEKAGGTGDAAAIASAALAAVDADKAPADAASPAAEDGDAATGTAAVAAAAADGTAAVVDEAPKRKTWKERRAEAKAAREAKKKAAAEAKAAAAAAAAGTVVAEGEAPTATPDAAAAAIAPIESAPLDARTPEATAPVETKKPRKTVGDTPAVADAAAAPVPEAPAAGGPARPIQVASFSKEENAKRAAEALAKIGVTASPQKSETNGKAVWGVVVMGDDAMLKKIKDAGFADAYYLK